MDEDQIQPIVAGDTQAQMQDKVNKAIAEINDARQRIKELGDSKAELKKLAERSAEELRAIRESNALTGRAPSGSESEMVGMYSTKAADGTPTVRMYSGEVRAQDGGGWESGLLDDTTDHGAWHSAVKGAASDCAFVALVRSRDPRDVRDPRIVRALAPRSVARLNRLLKAAPDGIKQRIFNSVDGSGGEFIPTEVRLPELIVALELKLSRGFTNLFRSAGMSSKTVVNPLLQAGGLTAYIMGEALNDDPDQFRSSQMSTSDRSRTAVRYGTRTVIDSDADEDSLIDSKATVIARAAGAMAIARENATINGDTAATHGDTGITSWNPRGVLASGGLGSGVDCRRAWIGLRHRAMDIGATAQLDLSDSLTYAKILQMRGMLAPAQGMDGDLILAISWDEYISDLLNIDQVATVDKYGPNAAAVTGEVARVAGLRVVTPFLLTSDTNATGIFDNATTTQGQTLTFNRNQFEYGVRRGFMAEADKDITRGIHNLVASRREIFWTLDPATTVNVVHGYNL